ncbi:hypothetical protein GCM10022409_14210 [Hymenobacter glaciei]|uniref:Uncharacterized protein n=1 Tax=Hymenobacter glaciei TaxID=877209 RepID=A0ABP7TTN5_9BACT
MKQPSRPPHELDVAGVLTPTEFNTAADLWRSIRQAGGRELTNCLLPSGVANRLPAVYFPVMQVVELVSAVGVQSIRARFVVLRDEKNHPHFSVVMYAAGANDTVLSSYYLATRYWSSKPGTSVAYSGPMAPKYSRDAPKHALPVALANYWVGNWGNAVRYPTSPALFTSAGQPLHGYNFALSDLMDPLRGLGEFKDQVLAMSFGLHTFLNSNGTIDAPVATLGLMLRMVNTSAKDEAGVGDEAGAGDDAYDVGTPCPPAP